jgi:VWFA-related protein
MKKQARKGHKRRWLSWLLLGILILSGLAAAALAQEPVNVTLNEVDSSKFPKVVAYATVSDANGHAIPQLPLEAFSLTEDGAPVKDLTVEALENVGEPIALVLALDTSGSMGGQPLAGTQTAAAQLVRNLGPADEVAVLSFSDEVTTHIEFTTDKEAAIAAVEALTAQGDTAFNDAVYQGAKLLAGRSRGRKALIVLTDGEDTKSVLTIEDGINALQEASIPVYVVGFGGNIQPKVLERLATLAGGHFYRSPSLDQINESFEAVARLLRYQYVLRFDSSLKADDASHTLHVTVDVGGVLGDAEADFVAGQREIAIEMHTPADGDTVGGKVTLKPQVESPGEILQVEYLLDGASLATVTTGEFAYEWDATAVPLGEHTLTVHVTDSAGNESQTEITLTVAHPIEVSITTPTGSRPVGGEVPVEVGVTALAGVVKVEYAVDGIVIETVETAPWGFTWDTMSLTTGAHTLKATAYDLTGQLAEASLELWVGLVIELADLNDGDTVGGLVTLKPSIEAPGDIAQVEYLLDGSLLTTVTTGEFAYEWDARTTTLGPHQLTTRVTDNLGNTGQLELDLTVVEPIVVTFVSPPEEELKQLSGEVLVEVEVAAVADVDKVEFALDGELVETVESSPYRFVWDTTTNATGEHTLTATVYDVKGLSEQASLEVWSAFRGTSWGLIAALAVLLLGGGVVLPLALRKRRKVVAGPVSTAQSVTSVRPDAGLQPARQAGQPVAWLIVEQGPETGRRWPVALGETSLGRNRADNDVVIPSRTASRRHAVIRADAGHCTYYDLQPTNPSLINDAPLVGAYELVQGDRIRIGDVVLRFSKER